MTSIEVRENPATLKLPVAGGQRSLVSLLPSLDPIAGARVRNQTGQKVYWGAGSVDTLSNNGVLRVEDAPQVIEILNPSWTLGFYPEATGTLDLEISPEPFQSFPDWQRTVQWINPEPLIDDITSSNYSSGDLNVEQWQGLQTSLLMFSEVERLGKVRFQWLEGGKTVALREYNLRVPNDDLFHRFEWRLPNLAPIFRLTVIWETVTTSWEVKAFAINPGPPTALSLGDGNKFELGGIRGSHNTTAGSDVVIPGTEFSGYNGRATLSLWKPAAANAALALEADRRDGLGFRRVAGVITAGGADTMAAQEIIVPPNICRLRASNADSVNRTLHYAITPELI